MGVEILQRFTCDYCGRMETEVACIGWHPGKTSSFSWPPPGWLMINEKLACPSHDVRVVNKFFGDKEAEASS